MLNDSCKTLVHYLLPKHALTRFAGFMADLKTPAVKNYLIRDFLSRYDVNMSEALEEDPTRYACFNDFFIRRLKPGIRPIADCDIVSPVDGTISEIGRISEGQLIQAKGKTYSVEEFLACDRSLSDQFLNGQFATLYLSPKDYHRIHMPIAASLRSMIHVPGQLFSVQPLTARCIPRLFARNERLVVFFDTAAGLMAMVLVGATIVGAIGTSWHGDLQRASKPRHFDYQNSEPVNLAQADEMGYFKLGSTVVLLFADGEQVQWEDELKAGTSIRYGQALAGIRNGPAD
ncbi:archaetidylserine decarboxylase [Legionella sp. CNM-4043-24]|uniref:archaetidylserine decarboxylase n=1 Tax=Legionella sp. CNM-4043-24 TaxID=3421646 RepID=UPI00403A9FFB